jgi:phage gp36-like protein
MAYCNINDLISSFGSDELAKITSGNPIDENKINTAIDYSCSLIDAYTYDRCFFDKDNVPLLIRKISSDLAYVILCEYYYSYNEVPNSAIRLKRASFQLMENLAKGIISPDAYNKSSGVIYTINRI